MKIDGTNVKMFRNDFADAVRALEAQYDVKISIGNISMRADKFTSSFTVKNNKVNGVDAEQYNFNRTRLGSDFSESDYKRKLKLQGETFELYGLNTRAPKNPCNIRSLKDGKTYKTSADTVKRCFI